MPNDNSTELQIVPNHRRKRWHDALYVLDINTAKLFGMSFYETFSWCLMHFGNIPAAFLLKVDCLRGQFFTKHSTTSAPCSTNERSATSAVERSGTHCSIVTRTRSSPDTATLVEDLERSLKKTTTGKFWHGHDIQTTGQRRSARVHVYRSMHIVPAL